MLEATTPLTTKLKEGDIYSWRWKDTSKHREGGPFGSYHCYSQVAEVKSGLLVDTYWSSMPTRHSFLDPSHVLLTLLGNRAELIEIKDAESVCYLDDDIVDLRHPNNPNGQILLRKGAKRDMTTMRNFAVQSRDRALEDVKVATMKADRYSKIIKMIDVGEFDEVYF